MASNTVVWTFAQHAQWTEAHSLRLAMLIGIFIVAVIALGVALLLVRRRMTATDNDMMGARSLLDHLREMRDSGEMTQDEYEATRRTLSAKVAQKLKAETAETPPPSYAPRVRRTSTVSSPSSPAGTPRPPSALLAPPGYDLTGDPLPGPATLKEPKNENN